MTARKTFVFFMLMFCVGSLFGQSFFDLVKTGTPEQVQAAIDAGANAKEPDSETGLTPLMYAAAVNENPEIITILVKAGARLNEHGGPSGSTTPLIFAAKYNENPDVIITLLKAGAKVDEADENGSTPLMNAAENNENPEVINVLLNAGANIYSRTKSEETPLMYAAHNKNSKVVTALLNAGSNVNDYDDFGATALMEAAIFNENPEVITILLNAGARINDQNKNGFTPLIWAATINRNPKIITTLLNAGANAKLKTNKGETALDHAEKNSKIKGTSAYEALKNAALSINTPSVSQNSGNSWVASSFGSYRIERLWEESRYTFVLVSYRNTTNMTFSSTVTLTAILYDANNRMLDMDDKSIYVMDSGPISPGFEGTVKISVAVIGSKRAEIRIQAR